MRKARFCEVGIPALQGGEDVNRIWVEPPGMRRRLISDPVAELGVTADLRPHGGRPEERRLPQALSLLAVRSLAWLGLVGARSVLHQAHHGPVLAVKEPAQAQRGDHVGVPAILAEELGHHAVAPRLRAAHRGLEPANFFVAIEQRHVHQSVMVGRSAQADHGVGVRPVLRVQARHHPGRERLRPAHERGEVGDDGVFGMLAQGLFPDRAISSRSHARLQSMSQKFPIGIGCSQK